MLDKAPWSCGGVLFFSELHLILLVNAEIPQGSQLTNKNNGLHKSINPLRP